MSISQNNTLICLTPVRNEAWILPLFIMKASEWADYIIIMDQCSTDGSREIARSFEKVILIENNDPTYDEAYRQKRLIDEARKLPGERKVLFALDADEIISLNWRYSKEWEIIMNARESSVLNFPWLTIIDYEKSWRLPKRKSFAFVDDNKTSHSGDLIHSTRVPIPNMKHDVLNLEEIGIVHLKLLSKKRNRSKIRWYQAFERIKYPQKNAIDLFRTYNNHEAPRKEELVDNKLEWIVDIENKNIIDHIIEIDNDENLWWDNEVKELIEKYGTDYFKKIDIWDLDFIPYKEINDPRSILDRMVHKWLIGTIKQRRAVLTRVIDKLLKKVW